MPLRSVVRTLLMALQAFKRPPLSLGKRKKVTLIKIRYIGRFFQYGDVLLGQELPYAQGVVSTCIVVVKQPRFALTQFLSLLGH